MIHRIERLPRLIMNPGNPKILKIVFRQWDERRYVKREFYVYIEQDEEIVNIEWELIFLSLRGAWFESLK